jgi:cytochrome P450
MCTDKESRTVNAITLAAPSATVWPPGPSSRAFLRSALLPGTNPIARFTAWQARYGNAFAFHLRGRHFAMFIGPDANQYLLATNAAAFTQGATVRLGPVLGKGLLTSDGPLHTTQRRLIQPAFHRGRIEAYQATMAAETARMLDRWHAGETLDFSAAMHDLTLTIVGRTLFAVDLAHQSDDIGQSVNAMIRFLRFRPVALFTGQINLPGFPYHRFLQYKAKMDAMVYGLIAEGRARETDNGDILSMLLAARDDDGTAMTDTQVRDEVLTFLAAGHETTANALGWTFMLLAQHPDICARLVGEIRAVLGDRLPTSADLARLTYLECVIKESMRLYPPAWAGTRIAQEEVELRGYRLPKGTIVGFSQYLTHRMPEHFAEPERFLPERFDPDHGEQHPPYAYIPFGAGPRSCIGSGFALMELKTIVPIILQRFQPALVPGQRIEIEPLVTLRAKRNIMMRISGTHATRGAFS